jgi:maltooligosyltrehalose trehalohydrolase
VPNLTDRKGSADRRPGTIAAVQPFGAIPAGEGRVEFRVWAPNARTVSVRTTSDTPLAATGDGVHEGVVDAAPGDDYLFVLDGGGALPDPCSRSQPGGLRGPSGIVDTRFEIAPGPELALDDLVLYELHVGTFTAEGTFDAAIPHLAPLPELGITAIELMPVATFPGERGWGYDGVYLSAPHCAYGGPEGLARLVDAAHRLGLGVVLDVVYNHVGPGSDALAAFGPYFTDRHETPWGAAIDYSQSAVREWAIQNAELWVRDYRIDGLRLDAVFAVFDDNPRHVLTELRERLPDALLIAEQEVGNLRPLEEWSFDAQWADEFHHELHVLLTGERDGYYVRYGTLDGLAAQLARKPAPRLVYCSQNHDQVGNRAQGDRPPRDELELRAALLLFCPQIPLLFMGEEYGERNPFQFFTDHIDPEIAEATRAGRKREFERFGGVAGELPDPQERATFERSKLSRREDAGVKAVYERFLALRRGLPRELRTSVEGDVLRARRGAAELTVDLARRTWELSA